MDEGLDFYREHILDHARNQRHWGLLHEPDFDHDGSNSLCGDYLRLTLKVEDGVIHSEASYLVVRTHRDSMPEILSVGRYQDKVVDTPDGYRFAERLCIFDNDLISNSLIYPI